jgi:hypothetical protein
VTAPPALQLQVSLAQPEEQKGSIQSIADAAKEAAAAGQQIHIVDKSTINQLEYSQREITALHDLLKFFVTKAPRYGGKRREGGQREEEGRKKEEGGGGDVKCEVGSWEKEGRERWREGGEWSKEHEVIFFFTN